MMDAGYCQCGCGQKAPISRYTWNAKGYVKGQPRQFIKGHNMMNGGASTGKDHYLWKGGTKIHQGYILIYFPEHPNAERSGYIREHILIASRVLGRPLRKGEIPHHVNHIRSDNTNVNLVICQGNSYHILLHRREEALKVCGHADWRKCYFCQEYDDPKNLFRKRYHHKCWIPEGEKSETRNDGN